MNATSWNNDKVELWLQEALAINRIFEYSFNTAQFYIRYCSAQKIVYHNQFCSLIFYYLQDRYSQGSYMQFSELRIQTALDTYRFHDIINGTDVSEYIQHNSKHNHISSINSYAQLLEKYLLDSLTRGDFFWENDQT